MSDVEHMKRVKDDTKLKCDVCLVVKDTTEFKETLRPPNSTPIDICKKCRQSIPSELINALSTGEPKWKDDAARSIIFSILESEDAYDYMNDVIFDLNEGVWAVFGNGEAEYYILTKLKDIKYLESNAKDREFNYRDYPMYLMAVLDNGKLRQYKTEWKLVEVKE